MSHPRFKVLSSNLVQQMTVLRRWRFWEYLPLLASVAGSLYCRETFFSVEKRGDRAKRRMRSQQESCCGLAFTELNGLKLIWNSALSLIAREFFSHQTSSCVPSRLELKLLFDLLLAVWNFSFRLSGGSKAFARNFEYCHQINTELILTHGSEFNTQCNADFHRAGSGVKIFPQAPLELTLWLSFKNGFNSHFDN